MVDYAVIVGTYVRHMRSWVGNKETNGHNRAPWIDKMAKAGKVPLGSPYCLLGATWALDEACKELGLVNPVKIRAGTQSFWDKTSIVYKRSTARTGMIGIFQVRTDKAHGHAVVVVENEDYDGDFKTIEFNTNISGSRDGDGVWAKTRNIDGDSRLVLRGFVDVAHWVCDANGVK